MNKDELIIRNELASSENYKEIRKKVLREIIRRANSPISSEVIRGMLLTINYIDGWIDDYNNALNKGE